MQIGEEAISSGSSKVVTASEDITVSIIPKTGYHVKSVQLNKKDVTDKIENNKIVITSINADQS